MNLIRRRSNTPAFRNDFIFPIQQHFDKFFEDFFKDVNIDSVRAAGSYPKMDIVVEGEEWVIKAAIPGVSPDEVNVDYTPGTDSNPPELIISGKMSEEHQSPDNADYFVRELKKSSFQRTLVLPKWLEGDPEASFKDGMLRLSWQLPDWVEEVAPKTKRIDVKRQDD